MAGERILRNDQYPDDVTVTSHVVDLSNTVQQRVLFFSDKRIVIDGIWVLGMKAGATSTVRLYSTPLGQDIAGTAGDASHPFLNDAVDVNAFTSTTATQVTETTVVNTENRLEVGSAVCILKTGTPAGKYVSILIRYRTVING